MRIRLATWRALHRWSSIVCTAAMLLTCLTGLPLIFSDEIENWQSAPATVTSGAEIPPDALVATARARHPDAWVRTVVFDRAAGQAIIYLTPGPDDDFARALTVRLGLHDGRALQDGTTRASVVLDLALRLHRELLAGLPGALFLGAMACAFLLAIVSGVALYFPFADRLRFGEVRRTGSRRLRWLDIHNLAGAVIAAWMAVVGATGAMNTLADPLFDLWEATDLAPVLAAVHGLPVRRPDVPLSAVLAATHAAVPNADISFVTYPTHLFGSPIHEVVWTQGRSKLRSRMMTPVLVDVRTGRVAMVAAMPFYLQLLEFSRPLHFGDYGGMLLKILWAALDVLTILVLVSGLYLLVAGRRRRMARAA